MEGGKSFSHAEGEGGGHNKFSNSFSHIEGGGGTKSFTLSFGCVCVWGGGGAKSFIPAIFPFCSPPPPPYN